MTLLDLFASIPNGIGVGAFMFVTITIMVARGWLVPRSHHEARVGDYREQRDLWKESSERNAEAAQKANEEIGATLVQVLNGIKEIADREQDTS